MSGLLHTLLSSALPIPGRTPSISHPDSAHPHLHDDTIFPLPPGPSHPKTPATSRTTNLHPNVNARASLRPPLPTSFHNMEDDPPERPDDHGAASAQPSAKPVLGKTEDGDRCPCTGQVEEKVSKGTLKSEMFKKKIRELEILTADEDMEFRYNGWSDKKRDYDEAMAKFDEVYNTYMDKKDRFHQAYAYLKKSYFEKCSPVEIRHDTYLNCGKLYSRAVDEFLARGQDPNCKVGVVSRVQPLAGELKHADKISNR